MLISQKILFTKNECDNILSIFKENEMHWKSKNRQYNSYELNFNSENEWIFDKLKTFFINETNLEIRKLKGQIHFHKYVIGDWFGKHNDSKDNRLYSIGVLLNDEFTGGDFKLYNDTELLLDKVVGNTYIFDVNIEHEITPILKGERYSLLWFLQGEHIKNNIKNII